MNTFDTTNSKPKYNMWQNTAWMVQIAWFKASYAPLGSGSAARKQKFHMRYFINTASK